MKNVVISMQNTLLSEAVARALSETGSFWVEHILPDRIADTEAICRAVHADVLLMEVGKLAQFTLEQRLALTKHVRS